MKSLCPWPIVESQSFKKLEGKSLSKSLDLPTFSSWQPEANHFTLLSLSFLTSIISKFCKNSIYISTPTHRIYNFQIQGIFVIALF